MTRDAERDPERDPVVRRAIDELQKLPQADAAAIRRVVAAAAVARITPADDEPMLGAPRRSFRFRTVAGVAAAAAFAGFALSSLWRDHGRPAPDQSAESSVVSPGLPVAYSAAEAVPINHQFVFTSRKAHRVSLVGDFNKWDPARARMTRETNNGLWSITLPVVPGRHIYGFMIDDSLFALDPHAPRAHDADLGADGSVVIVGKP
jgi:hypothetical protein